MTIAMNTAAALRKRLAAGETVFGAWAALPCGFSAELLCVPGVDYVCIDQQHGLIDYPDMVNMLRAIEGRGSAVPFTRVPVNQAWVIGKAFDAGIQGVVVPMVSTREEAAAAVAACRYAPQGVRSFGPVRASMVLGTRNNDVIGNSVMCFVMVETRLGVENIEEIASTPGLDGIYIGPADLALGLGLAPDLDKQEPEHVAAVAKILAACQKHGVVPGIQCGNGTSARKYADRGFRFVTFTKDSSLLPSAVEKGIAAAIGGDAAVKQVAEKGYV
jgi:4-hydroxy-2-oxoheptanedioate aldolase